MTTEIKVYGGAWKHAFYFHNQQEFALDQKFVRLPKLKHWTANVADHLEQFIEAFGGEAAFGATPDRLKQAKEDCQRMDALVVAMVFEPGALFGTMSRRAFQGLKSLHPQWIPQQAPEEGSEDQVSQCA